MSPNAVQEPTVPSSPTVATRRLTDRRPDLHHAPFSRRIVSTLATLALLVWVAACQPQPEPEDATFGASPPKNVIFFVLDGMGYNQIDAASMYHQGAARYQVGGPPGEVEPVGEPSEPIWSFEHFPVQLAVSTHTALGQYDPQEAWTDFESVIGIEYEPTTVTGSAAAATALSSGVKSIDPAVGLDANGEPVFHLADRARELGKATGIVTNVPLNHATPAGFLVHNESRTNYHEIARAMIMESNATLIMGTGHPYFDDNAQPREEPNYFWIPEDVWGQVSGNQTSWTLVHELEDFRALASGPTPERVLGIPHVTTADQFNRDPTPLARSHREGPPGRVDPLEMPFETPLNENVPSLAEMTAGALNVLRNASDEGFFVMIESGALDWGGHWNLMGRAIEEIFFTDDAVQAVIDWVEAESSWDETLIIVTSDHEAGHLWGPGSNPDWQPLENRGPDSLPGFEWYHTYHTNQLVPLFARGAGAEGFHAYAEGRNDPVRGPYLDNTEIAQWIFELWGEG
ncbi:MAG: alkaline phosphatase [Gemmatimonadales bacterium]|nr:MAG: alkaline phosphatase [Gemmatimonadales bacterium]